jgi:hypothetical protein
MSEIEMTTLPQNQTAHFNGPEYDPKFDHVRLTGQIKRIYDLMQDGTWRTLDEIHRGTGDPHASISAQLRHLRKPRFGSHIVDRRARGDRSNGLYEYQLVIPEGQQMEML